MSSYSLFSSHYKDLRSFLQKVRGQCRELVMEIQKGSLTPNHVQVEAVSCLKNLSHLLSQRDGNLKRLNGIVNKLSQPMINEIDQQWPKQMSTIKNNSVMIHYLVRTQQGKNLSKKDLSEDLSAAVAEALESKAFHPLLKMVNAHLDLKLLLPNKQMLWVEILRAMMKQEEEVSQEQLQNKLALKEAVIDFMKKNKQLVLSNGVADRLLIESVASQDIKVTILLIVLGAKLSKTEQEKKFLAKICAWISLEDSTRPFLSQLIKQHALPFEEMQDGSLLIATILKSHDVVLKRLVNECYFINPNITGALLCLNAKGKRFIEIREICEELKITKAMQKTIAFLKWKWDSGIQEYCKEAILDTQQRMERAQKWLEEHDSKDLLPLVYRAEGEYGHSHISIELARDALTLCYRQGKLQLIGPLISRLMDFEPKHFNQAQTNFHLDKYWIGLRENKHIPLPYIGGFYEQNAWMFVEAIWRRRQQLECLKQPTAEERTLQKLYGKLIDSLLLSVKWEYEVRHCRQYRQVAQEIVENLKKPQRHSPLVVPIGPYRHAMLLTIPDIDEELVQRNDSEVVLGVTNTGLGVDKFHSPQGVLFQTTITFKAKRSTLLKVELWENLLKAQHSPLVDDCYAALKEFGLQDQPSTLQNDRGQGQMRESCSAQVLVKWFKYIIGANIKSGSPATKIGVYKREKGLILMNIEDLESVDDGIKRGLEQKMAKRRVFMQLDAIAENHQAFMAIWKTACFWLKETGRKATSKQLRELKITNVYEKAYFLREWTYMLAWERLENPHDLFWFPLEARMKKVWACSTVLLEEKQRIKTYITEALNQHKHDQAWMDMIELIVYIEKRTTYGFLAFDWLSEQIKNEETVKKSVFKKSCLKAIQQKLQQQKQEIRDLDPEPSSKVKYKDGKLTQAFGLAIQGKPLLKKPNTHRMRHFIGQNFHE